MMTDKTDIFNLSNQSDLPEKMRHELIINEHRKTSKEIERLLQQEGRPINLDEVVVGMYRMFGINKSRRYWRMKMYNETRSKNSRVFAVKGKRACYEYK